MEAFYMFANFGWGTFFFLLGMAGAVVAVVKLDGLWRLLPVGMALFWGVGTGLFMYGQFWLDRHVLRGFDGTTVPVMGNQLSCDLDLLARSKVKSLPDFSFEGEGPGLVLDSASILASEDPVMGNLGGGRTSRAVELSFFYPEIPEIERLYVVCIQMQTNQWIVARIYTKKLDEGKVKRVVIWSA